MWQIQSAMLSLLFGMIEVLCVPFLSGVQTTTTTIATYVRRHRLNENNEENKNNQLRKKRVNKAAKFTLHVKYNNIFRCAILNGHYVL